jgi:hypothetical protein
MRTIVRTKIVSETAIYTLAASPAAEARLADA